MQGMISLSKYEVLACTALLGMVGLLVLGSDGRALQRFAPDTATSFDPKLGMKVALPATDVQDKTIGAKTTLLVIAGSCTGCSKDALDPKRLSVPPGWQVVVVYSTDADKIPKALRNPGDPIRIVSDPMSHISIHLNAVWKPRWYVLDANQQLTSLSKRQGDWPKEVTYANP